MRFDTEEARALLAPVDAKEERDLRETLRKLSRPRLTGSKEAAAADKDLRRRFEKLGYRITDLPFSFSSLPGRFGLMVVGVLYLAGILGALLLLRAGSAGAAVGTLFLLAAALGVLASFGRRLIGRLRWGRIATANWLIQRPAARPRYILMAHRDSKSQPIPLLLRAVGIAGAVAGWLLLTLLGLSAFFFAPPAGALVWLVGLLALAAGVLLVLSWAGNESPGALDNASGLAALLTLAQRERERDDVAFLITDGEELGLAGAAAVCGELPPVFGVINLDGLDDEGIFRIVERHGLPRRGMAPHLAAALMTAAAAMDVQAKRGTVPVGVMVDHMPLVDAGIPAITLMRGTAASLRRVHRPGDDADHIEGRGVAATVTLLSAALALLRMPAAVTEPVLPETLVPRAHPAG
jgi:hypothetical protein